MEEEVCRLCLQTNPRIKIFYGNILEKIRTFCNIKLDIDDKLPKHICEICSKTLDNMIEFKTKCELNDKILKNKVSCGTNFQIKWESDSDRDDLFTFEDMPITKDEILTDNDNTCEKEIKGQLRKKKSKRRSILEVANNSIIENDKNGIKNINDIIKYEIPILYSPKKGMMRKNNKNFKLKKYYKSPISYLPQRKRTRKGINKRKVKDEEFVIGESLIKTEDICPFCGELFKAKDLPSHILNHNPRPFQCHLCQNTFKYKCKLIPHLKTHCTSDGKEEIDKKEIKVECNLCGKFIHEFFLKHHLPDNRDKKNYECHICKQGFISKTCHLFHVRRHGPQPKKEKKSKPPDYSQCHICGKTQSSKSRTKRHITIAHLKNDYIQCKLCGKTMRKNHKPYHMKHAHVMEKKFECDVCKQKFISRERIREHLKTHSSLKPFQCNICGGKFTRNNTLKRHLLRHENRLQKGFESELNSQCDIHM